jgi:predicted PurR-regulated permease PerM
MASLIGGTLPLLNTALGFVTGLALVIAAGAFLAVEPKSYVAGLVRRVPRSHRGRAREVLPLAGQSLRQWIKGTAIGMLVIAVLTTVGLSIIGVPAALALGVIAGLLEFVPYVGPAASFVPAVAVALAVSPQKVVAVVALYGAIQFVESFLLIPLLMRGMVRLPPALTLLFQSFMAALFGFLGLLLAVPILAFGKVLVQELYVEPVADER